MCKQNWSLPDQKGIKSWVQIIIATVLIRANRTRKKWAYCSNSCPHFLKCLQSNVTTVRHSQRNFHKKNQLTIRMQKFEEQKVRVKKYLTSENFVYINSGLGWVGIKGSYKGASIAATKLLIRRQMRHSFGSHFGWLLRRPQ